METDTAYLQHMSLMQNYNISDGRKAYQASFAEAFEKIYSEAKDADIKLSNAKEFLSALDSSELRTLQKYNSLAEAIDVDAISAEGAYNLLMHDNEQFDFNNDGLMEVGEGKSLMPIPRNMPNDVKAAYIEALNSLSDKERLMAMTLSFDMQRIKSVLDNTTYTPSLIDYEYLQNSVHNVLNPQNGEYSSEEFKALVEKFWTAFNAEYGNSEETKANSEETNSAVEEFLQKLRELGAARFLHELNQEKIEEQVEKYRAQLIQNMDKNSMSMDDIEKLVQDFKKQLLEQLQLIAEQEKSMKSADYFEIKSSLLQNKDEHQEELLELLLAQITRGSSSSELEKL
ncbi:MAG: hypothetical protein JXQ67_09405 [Campylobacterales bacterium]|nr:hypothetical protein [Campylobacterales bacterium]